mgnify:CR=1 FL=1
MTNDEIEKREMRKRLWAMVQDDLPHLYDKEAALVYLKEKYNRYTEAEEAIKDVRHYINRLEDVVKRCLGIFEDCIYLELSPTAWGVLGEEPVDEEVGKRTHSFYQEIKSHLSIVDIISGHLDLERSGHNFRARCPFHAETIPSFFVFPERQTWRCFGDCEEGGDALTFMMKAENIDFSEVIKKLAYQFNLSMPATIKSIPNEGPIWEGKAGTYPIIEMLRNVLNGTETRGDGTDEEI